MDAWLNGTFSSKIYKLYVREIIQNSLDVQKNQDIPVGVSFQLDELKASDIEIETFNETY